MLISDLINLFAVFRYAMWSNDTIKLTEYEQRKAESEYENECV